MEFHEADFYRKKYSDEDLAERIRSKLVEYKQTAGRAEFKISESEPEQGVESTVSIKQSEQVAEEVDWLG